MRRSSHSVLRWSEAILQQLGNPRVSKLFAETVDDVNANVVNAGLTPGTDLVLSPVKTSETSQSGVLVGLSLHPEGYGVLVVLPHDLSDSEAIVLLADRLQEEVLESTHGKAVPPCPGHPHPANPELLGKTPYWVCPSNRKAVLQVDIKG